MITLQNYLTWVLILLASLIFTAGLVPALVGAATASCITWVRLDIRLLSFFGLISYSLYLVHWTLGLPVLGFLQSKTGDSYSALGVTVTLTIFAAFLYYRLIERPSQLLSSRFSYRPPPDRAPALYITALPLHPDCEAQRSASGI